MLLSNKHRIVCADLTYPISMAGVRVRMREARARLLRWLALCKLNLA